MNPFDLRGPEFLLFYLLLGVVVLALQYAAQRVFESRDDAPPRLVDPYMIAALRGGGRSAVHVGIMSLLDRGLLIFEDKHLAPAENASSDSVDHPLEKAIMQCAGGHPKPFEVGGDMLGQDCRSMEDALKAGGLLADSAAWSRRILICAFCVLLLLTVVGVKTEIAHARGHSNTQFMQILFVGFCFVSVLIVRKRRTQFGDQTLSGLKALCSDLSNRAFTFQPGSQTRELMMIAAVFGVERVPPGAFPYPVGFFRSPSKSGTVDGSGCGGGGGGGCGGGCGGGGCGGCGA